MLRKVKLYIENTAFDDNRILRKRGHSGIVLAKKDAIFKKMKSTGQQNGILQASSIQEITPKQNKVTQASNKVFKMLDEKDTQKSKKTCVVNINGELSEPLIEGILQSYDFSSNGDTSEAVEDEKNSKKSNLKVTKLMLKMESNSINDLHIVKYYPENAPKSSLPYIIVFYGCNEIKKIRTFPKHQKLVNYN